MVTLVGLLQEIYDELVVVVSNNTSVSTPKDHVGMLNRTKDIQYPFFGFEWDRFPISEGMGSNRTVSKINKSGGNIDSIDYDRKYELILDIGAVVKDDFPRQRDEYINDIESHFAPLAAHPTNLHSDISRIRQESASPMSGGDSNDVGVRLTYNIEYCTTDTEDVTAAETVNLDVDSSGTDAYPEKY